MKHQKSVIDLIRARTSTRSYEDKNIDSLALEKLKDYIAKINEESTIKVRFMFTNVNKLDKEKTQKLGTYGVITGAKSYLIVVLHKNEDALELGYLFEKIVLFATDLGLGTCWLGGTFKKNDFEDTLELDDDEYIPIVSPIGYRKEKTRILDSTMRAFAGSDKRKAWKQLFFQDDISTPLDENMAGPYSLPLEMVRLGPSASNKQPWRIIISDDKFHFFLCRNKGYGVKDYDLQKNDIGIAKCHFELSANELGLKGKWETLDNINRPNEWEYMMTYIL